MQFRVDNLSGVYPLEMNCAISQPLPSRGYDAGRFDTVSAKPKKQTFSHTCFNQDVVTQSPNCSKETQNGWNKSPRLTTRSSKEVCNSALRVV